MTKLLMYTTIVLLVVVAVNLIQLNNRVTFIEDLIRKAFLTEDISVESVKTKALSILKKKLF